MIKFLRNKHFLINLVVKIITKVHPVISHNIAKINFFKDSFFLLNLTLAVINSKFTEAHNEQQKADQEALREASHLAVIDNELEDAMNKKDEMSIAQFITARIYAKKMIEFLRMR